MTYNLAELSPLKRHWISNLANFPMRFDGWDRQSIIDSSGEFPAQVDLWLKKAVSGKIIMNGGDVDHCGVGLLFDGSAGRGKTTHAVVTAVEFILQLPDDEDEMRKVLHAKRSDFGRQFHAVKFLTFPEFMSLKKSTYDGDNEERRELSRKVEGLHGRAKEDWLNVRLLVLDDLSKKSGTRHDDTSFDELLRSRHDHGLPTLVTSNIMREDWGLAYQDESLGSFVFEAFRRVNFNQKKDFRSNN